MFKLAVCREALLIGGWWKQRFHPPTTLYGISFIGSQHFLMALLEIEETDAAVGGTIARGIAEGAEGSRALITLLEDQRGDFGDHLRDRFRARKRRRLLIGQRVLGARLKPLRERLEKVTIRSNEKIARALGGNRSRKIGVGPSEQ